MGCPQISEEFKMRQRCERQLDIERAITIDERDETPPLRHKCWYDSFHLHRISATSSTVINISATQSSSFLKDCEIICVEWGLWFMLRTSKTPSETQSCLNGTKSPVIPVTATIMIQEPPQKMPDLQPHTARHPKRANFRI